jgi:hypothetical protein
MCLLVASRWHNWAYIDDGERGHALSQKTAPSTTSGGPQSGMPPRCCPIDYRSCFVLNCSMSVILEINRDFPFQVPLSFDEAAMDILDWLEECAFEWDMYVDLPANTVRYCFRTLEDAAAFKGQFIDAPQGRAGAKLSARS